MPVTVGGVTSTPGVVRRCRWRPGGAGVGEEVQVVVRRCRCGEMQAEVR